MNRRRTRHYCVQSFNNRENNIIVTIPTINSFIQNQKDFYIVADYDSNATTTENKS